MCPAVDDITATARALGPVNRLDLDEMGDIVTADLPIGLEQPAMEQVDAQCDPDFSELQVPSP